MNNISTLAAFGLAVALAVPAAAQGCACTSFAPNVVVTVSEGGGNAAKVDQERVCLAKNGVITFLSEEGDVEVIFNKGDGSPFAFDRVRRTRGQRFGARISQANTQQCGKPFRYSIKLTKDGRSLALDPEIIVEPGGEQGR